MKLAIISDTHFGDDTCLLVTRLTNGAVVRGPKYEEFAKAVGQGNDYLVLAGDIFDFSITDYATAFECGKLFFELVKAGGLAKEMVYLPGNHEAEIWHIVQHQRSIINRMGNGKLPEQFQHSVAAVIDDRSATPKALQGLTLDKTSAQSEGGPKYGGMFLDHITTPPTIFNFAYPNLYTLSRTERRPSSHTGSTWNRTGRSLARWPSSWPLRISRLARYLDRLEKEIDHLTDYGWLKELVCDFIMGKVKGEVLEMLGSVKQTRYSQEFIFKRNVRERFRRFYAATLLEIGDINERTGQNIPAPWRVIFGHTHQPISWEDQGAPKIEPESSGAPKPLVLNNTGGWLGADGSFCGADIFVYETQEGFRSIPMR